MRFALPGCVLLLLAPCSAFASSGPDLPVDLGEPILATKSTFAPRLSIETASHGSFVLEAPSQDTWIKTSSTAPLTILKAHVRAPLNRFGRILVQFPLQGIPAGAVVTNATLSLYAVYTSEWKPRTMVAARVTEAWSESTASWTHRDATTPWASEGGSHDLAGAAVTFVDNPYPGEPNLAVMATWIDWDVTGLVADWVSGVAPNYGLLLIPDEAAGGNGNNEIGFASREHLSGSIHHFQLGSATEVCPQLNPVVFNAGTDVLFEVDAATLGSIQQYGGLVAFDAGHVTKGGIDVTFNGTPIANLGGSADCDLGTYQAEVTALVQLGSNYLTIRDQHPVSYAVVGDFQLRAGPAIVLVDEVWDSSLYACSDAATLTLTFQSLDLPGTVDVSAIAREYGSGPDLPIGSASIAVGAGQTVQLQLPSWTIPACDPQRIYNTELDWSVEGLRRPLAAGPAAVSTTLDPVAVQTTEAEMILCEDGAACREAQLGMLPFMGVITALDTEKAIYCLSNAYAAQDPVTCPDCAGISSLLTYIAGLHAFGTAVDVFEVADLIGGEVSLPVSLTLLIPDLSLATIVCAAEIAYWQEGFKRNATLQEFQSSLQTAFSESGMPYSSHLTIRGAGDPTVEIPGATTSTDEIGIKGTAIFDILGPAPSFGVMVGDNPVALGSGDLNPSAECTVRFQSTLSQDVELGLLHALSDGSVVNLTFPPIASGPDTEIFLYLNWDLANPPAHVDLDGDGTVDQWIYADGPTPATPRAGTARLESVRPNPFNPRTTIRFWLPEPMQVDLRVVSPSGRIVRSFARESWAQGFHSMTWDGTDSRGLPVASGVYLVDFRAGTTRETRRAILLK